MMRPAKHGSAQPRSGKSRRAFTLIEMLVVMGIMAILIAMVAPAFRQMIASQAPRTAAMEFTSAVRSARQYAIDHSTRTRVVFANKELASNNTSLSANRSFAVQRYYVPTQPLGATQVSVISNPPGTSTPQIDAHQPVLSIPPGFVGQWLPLAGEAAWDTPPPSVAVEGDIFPPVGGTNDQQFASNHYYKPPSAWAPSGSYGAFSNNISTFPGNYTRVSDQLPYRLTRTNVIPGYETRWPTNITYQYFAGADDTVGGATGTKATNFYFLRGIEFDGRGTPQFGTNVPHTNQLQFKFTRRFPSGALSPDDYYEVVVDRVTGLPRMLE